MATQQEVIKKFMASLDTTSKSGTVALDEAIDYATNGTSRHFSTIAEAIAAMKADINSTNNADTFLKDFCGINLDNTDTGAITGSDAGGSTTKTAKSVVPENGALDTSFLENQFTLSKYGITFYLSKIDSNGLVVRKYDSQGNEIPSLDFENLSDNKQKYVWRALKTWWASGALDLIAESYGSNFGFSSSHLIVPKIIYFGFYEGDDYTGLSTAPFHLNGDTKATARLAITANMNVKQYGNIDTSDPNGANINSNVYYMDRAIAHELTHAVMSANIEYYYDLPQFITEGMAELTHGADDSQERQSYMKALASKNSSLFDKTFNVNEIGTGDSNAYAGGYMFLRYLAKQAVEPAITSGVINNTLDNTSIATTDDNKIITNSGKYVTITTGAGNDSVENSGYNVTVNSGAGKDTITSKYTNYLSVMGGTGDDLVSLFSVWYGTIDSGAGNDTIISPTNARNDSINGGDGHDLISLKSSYSGSTSTIVGGKGNDTIIGDSVAHLYKYSNGDGNDSIVGFSANSTLSISGSYSTAKSGNSILVTVGDGKVTLVGAASLSSVNILPTVNPNPFTESDDTYRNSVSSVSLNALGGKDSIYNTGANVIIYGGTGDDSVSNRANKVTIRGGNGNDTIWNNSGSNSVLADGGADNDYIISWGDNSTLLGGDGDDTITNAAQALNSNGSIIAEGLGKNVTINCGVGNDSIYNTGNYVTISGGDDDDFLWNSKFHDGGNNVSISGGNRNDTIVNGGSQVTILGGMGNDLISLGSDSTNNVIQFSAGDGNDTIRGFNTKSTLSIGNGKGTYSAETVDGNVIITVGDNKIILTGAASLSSVNIIPTINTNQTLTLTDSSSSAMTIPSGHKNADASARSKAIKIVGNALDNSILGGKVADTLNGGAGNDTLTGGWKGDLFIYTGGKDVITDYNPSAGDKVSLAGDGAKYLSHITGVSVKNNNVTLTFSKDSNKTLTINNAANKKVIVNGNTRYFDDKQILSADKKSATLTSGFSGTFNANGYKGVNASAVTQAVTISGANSIVGGSKADSLIGTTGNDTLTGGYGADTYVYTGGKDVITDYAVNFDKITLAGTGAKYLSHITGVSVKNNNVTLTFSKDSSKTLTLNNAAGKKVILNGNTRIFEDGKIYTADKSKYTVASAADVYWFDENNFDGVQLDSIVDNASDYSLGKLETTDNLTKLTQDEFLLTYGDDKK